MAQRLRRTLGKRVGAIPRRFESCLLRSSEQDFFASFLLDRNFRVYKSALPLKIAMQFCLRGPTILMRIIFLNSWFGKAGKPLFDFVKSESSKTDIFCFMEVSSGLFKECSAVLSDFGSIYDKGMVLKVFGVNCGQAIFVNKKIKILSNGKLNIYRQLSYDMGFMQFMEVKSQNGTFWIGSVDGKTRPGDKRDTQTRIKQSKKIIDFFKDKKGPKIIGGDFNLDLGTKSVKMFEEAGYTNLIKKFDIKNTRNILCWEQFKNLPGFTKQHYADFCFTSQEVKVNEFQVPYMEISDHLPLILDFEV